MEGTRTRADLYQDDGGRPATFFTRMLPRDSILQRRTSLSSYSTVEDEGGKEEEEEQWTIHD